MAGCKRWVLDRQRSNHIVNWAPSPAPSLAHQLLSKKHRTETSPVPSPCHCCPKFLSLRSPATSLSLFPMGNFKSALTPKSTLSFSIVTALFIYFSRMNMAAWLRVLLPSSSVPWVPSCLTRCPGIHSTLFFVPHLLSLSHLPVPLWIFSSSFLNIPLPISPSDSMHHPHPYPILSFPICRRKGHLVIGLYLCLGCNCVLPHSFLSLKHPN